MIIWFSLLSRFELLRHLAFSGSCRKCRTYLRLQAPVVGDRQRHVVGPGQVVVMARGRARRDGGPAIAERPLVRDDVPVAVERPRPVEEHVVIDARVRRREVERGHRRPVGRQDDARPGQADLHRPGQGRRVVGADRRHRHGHQHVALLRRTRGRRAVGQHRATVRSGRDRLGRELPEVDGRRPDVRLGPERQTAHRLTRRVARHHLENRLRVAVLRDHVGRGGHRE